MYLGHKIITLYQILTILFQPFLLQDIFSAILDETSVTVEITRGCPELYTLVDDVCGRSCNQEFIMPVHNLGF